MAIRTKGADDLNQLGAALKEAGDRDLTKQLRKEFREIGRPIGRKVLIKGAEEMPQRNGFAARVVEQGRVGIGASLGGRITSVRIILKNKGVDLRRVDRGILRHPVWGNRENWVAQQVPEGAFTRAFNSEAKEARKAALTAAQATLKTVSRKV